MTSKCLERYSFFDLKKKYSIMYWNVVMERIDIADLSLNTLFSHFVKYYNFDNTISLFKSKLSKLKRNYICSYVFEHASAQ